MDTCKTIADHKISIGMTSEQVIEAWGQPQTVNTTITSRGAQDTNSGSTASASMFTLEMVS